MLNLEEGKQVVQLARKSVEHYVTKKDMPSLKGSNFFSEKLGVFVTLHTYPEHTLRGCIGIPLPVLPLHKAIVESATSATHDPRFPPLDATELTSVILEVTLLTKPETLHVESPQDYLSHIEIGRDGLIVEQGFQKGLLLPQVPLEQGWDKEEFLSQTCMKAGLLPDAWYDTATVISKFSGQIFTELTPQGDVKEKYLHGPDNRR
jgi:hypothetical protein